MQAPTLDRKAKWILGLAALIVCALSFGRAAPVWRDHFEARYDLAYETPNLRTVELLHDGRNPYERGVYAAPPFWLTMYTPLYHAVCAALPVDPARPFARGREVNFACAVALAMLLFMLPGREWAVAALACGALFLVRPVCSNTVLLKGDFLGVFCSVVGVLCAWKARDRALWVVPAACAAALALATKQSFVAGAAASGLFLLAAKPRAGLAFGALFAALVGGLALAAHLAWGPGFWFSIWTAPQNPWSAAVFRGLWSEMLVQPVSILNLAVGVCVIAWLARMRGRALLTDSPFPLYVACSAAVLSATLGKQGAATNYFHEWEFASLALLVVATPVIAPAIGRWRYALGVGVLFVAAACAEIGLSRSEALGYRYTTREANRFVSQNLEQLGAEIRAISGERPRILNLYYAGLGYPLPGEICVNDPYLYALLFQTGKLDPKIVIDALATRAMDAAIVPAGYLSGRFPVAPPLANALNQNYVLAKRFTQSIQGGFDYYVRR